MGRGSGDEGKNAFAHIKSKQHRARRLRTLQDGVSGELGAEYLVKHLPDTGQIVLTPVDRLGIGALPTAPSMWEKTVAAVWRIRSLHMSRSEAPYLTPHLVEGIPWEDVWVSMQQLAQPALKGFVAKSGDDTKLYGPFCPLPARLQHLYRCRPVEPAHVQQPGTPRLHCMQLAFDSMSTRHDDGPRHVKQAFKRIGDTLVDAVINFLIRALANLPVLEGLDLYRWGRVGSFLCSSTGFTLHTGS